MIKFSLRWVCVTRIGPVLGVRGSPNLHGKKGKRKRVEYLEARNGVFASEDRCEASC